MTLGLTRHLSNLLSSKLSGQARIATTSYHIGLDPATSLLLP